MRKIIKDTIKIFIVCVGLIALYAGIKFVKYKIEDNSSKHDVEYNNNIQYVANSIRLINKLEENNIHIDEEYKKEITDYSKKILNRYDKIDASVVNVVDLYTISYYVDDSYKKDIIEYVEKYYINDSRLLNEFIITEENTDKIEIEKDIDYNCSALQECYGTDFDEIFHITEGLANWVNTKDENTISEYESEEIDWVINCLVKYNKIDLIKKERLQKKCEEYKKEVVCFDSKDCNETMNCIVDLQDLKVKSVILGMNNELEKKIYETWKKIDSKERLEFDVEDRQAPLWLMLSIEDIDELDNNEFFKRNINALLKESYKNIVENGME